MDWLTLDELDRNAKEFDALVYQTPQIDTFCSASAWTIPAARTMLESADPFITRSEDGFVAMMLTPMSNGLQAAVPLEIGWGLAAPFAGPDQERLVAQLRRMWAEQSDRVNALIVSGIPASGPWSESIVKTFVSTHRIGLGETCGRCMASLDGGLDGYLARRSPGFRAKLRQAIRRAARSGVDYEYHCKDPTESIFERVLAVESDSWKGRAGQGFDQPPGEDFYRLMSKRLHQQDSLRVVFVRQEDQDIGFVLGGVAGPVYRGLQMSFRAGYEELQPGNLGQIKMIERLIADGVSTYDLGTDMPYKRRWAEQEFTTQMFAIMPYV